MGRKGKLAVFESSNISKTGEVTPTKIGIHVCYIKAYMHEFFKTILSKWIFNYLTTFLYFVAFLCL